MVDECVGGSPLKAIKSGIESAVVWAGARVAVVAMV